ncbi:hypothetical protein [Yinghuangia soli]|uniref:Leucine-rich repeat domain-containing protein n=1 Tax=Yinghuangia soli TaxID=2908204 RepID=A0AA41QA12_9ACTN|nr:hypothetical protein [Yinghuangia soli]MCF2533124.1 hypothetical protein [Yinghuangia soli]
MEPQVREGLERARLRQRLRGRGTEAITDLRISNAASLNGVRNFPALEVLILDGCDPVSLAGLPRMDQLISLTVQDSGLRDLDGIDRFANLSVLTVQRNLLHDLGPLLACNATNIAVSGNPLSRQSYEEILPELAARGVRVSADEPREWQLTCRMHAAGVPFSCWKSGSEHFLYAPGLGFRERDRIAIDVDEVEATIARNPRELLTLFERFAEDAAHATEE